MANTITVSVPSRGSRLSNIKAAFWIAATLFTFPSPRGAQGYPTHNIIQALDRFTEFPSPRGVQGYPTRRVRRTTASVFPSFRPLAGFKVIQHQGSLLDSGDAVHVSVPSRGSRLSNAQHHPSFGPLYRVSVPSRGSRLSNKTREANDRKRVSKFPSPRGVQGYPTGKESNE